MRRTLAIAAVLLLTGCAKYYWTKPGATAADFDRDNLACARAAMGLEESVGVGIAHGGAQYFKGTKVNEATFRLCLAERGYRRGKYSAPPENGWRGFTDEN